MTSTPEQVIAKIREENAALRKIIHECANALPNGAYCSPECSLGFMAEVPKEIRLVTVEIKARAEAAEAERDALRKANQKLHRRAQVFEGAFQAADHELTLWEPTLAHHKLSQHDLLVRHIRVGLDKSFRRARTLLAGDNHE